MTTKITPLHDRVIVKRIDEGEQIRGGIIIPDSAKEKPQEGEVIAAGTTIVSLGDLDHPWLRAYIGERDLGRVKLGDKFGMSMKLGIPYSMVSEVIEFEDDRRIAWQSRPPGVFGKISGGRIWRYELEPVDGGTRVRETWDISHEIGTKLMLRNSRVHQHTREAMEKTLANIEQLLATP